MPFTLKFTNDINNSNNKELNIDAKKIELNIFNRLQKKSEDLIEGINILSIMNSKIHTFLHQHFLHRQDDLLEKTFFHVHD